MTKDYKKLLEIAKSEGKVTFTDQETNNDVHKFFIDNKINCGKIRYEKHFIYLMYILWSKKEKPYASNSFHRIANKLLKSHSKKWYSISDEFKFDKEDVERKMIRLIFNRAKKNVNKQQKEKKKSTKS